MAGDCLYGWHQDSGDSLSNLKPYCFSTNNHQHPSLSPEPRSHATQQFSSRSLNHVRGTVLKMFKRRESLTSAAAKRKQEPRATEATITLVVATGGERQI